MRMFSGRGAVFAALALGAFTSFIAWKYVDQASQNQQVVQMTPVVVASAPIGPRTMITPDMVRVQRMPADAVHPAVAHSPTEVVGKVTRLGMVADEQVLTSKLYLQREQSGLAFNVPEGMRAVSVAVSEVIGSGGMIVAGDRVDVIGVFEVQVPAGSTAGTVKPSPTAVPPIVPRDDRSVQTTQQGGNPNDQLEKSYIATTVLEDVPVLAIAQNLEGEDTRDNTQKLIQSNSNSTEQLKSNPQPAPAAKTATFAVNPEDALKLVLAEDRGKIRLALRRGGPNPATAQQPQQQQQQSQRPEPQVPMSALVAPRGN